MHFMCFMSSYPIVFICFYICFKKCCIVKFHSLGKYNDNNIIIFPKKVCVFAIAQRNNGCLCRKLSSASKYLLLHQVLLMCADLSGSISAEQHEAQNRLTGEWVAL